jgi:hypothetical protein
MLPVSRNLQRRSFVSKYKPVRPAAQEYPETEMQIRVPNPAPVEGVIIIALAGQAEKPQLKRWSRLVWLLGLLALVIGAVTFGLGVGALIHGEFSALVMGAVGPILWTLGGLLSLRGSKDSTRDEETVALLDQLKEHTPPEELGRLTPSKEKLAWLKPIGKKVAWFTDQDIYVSVGARLQWGSFESYSIERLNSTVHKISLWKNPGGTLAEQLAGARNLLFFGGGIIAEAAAAWFGLRQYGPRDAVLATAFCALFFAAIMSLTFYDEWRKTVRSSVSRRLCAGVFYLNALQVPLEEAEAMLAKHLAPEGTELKLADRILH